MSRAEIEIERVAGLAFVQDGGRPGRLSGGIPAGGALVPEALARANAAVGNAPGAASIERFGAITLVGRGDESIVAEDDGVVRRVRAGERIELGWDGTVRARYVALRGGVDVPVVLGGRGTLVSARIGGLDGRALRKGDVLRASASPAPAERAPAAALAARAIRVVAGPDLATFAPDALRALTSHPWSISPRSDRTGTRLVGPKIAYRGDAPALETTPMVAGAVELPPSGEPIVLGPDHPTTGGYPVVAIVARIDLGRFHTIPLGGEVRFTEIDAASARALWRASLEREEPGA